MNSFHLRQLLLNSRVLPMRLPSTRLMLAIRPSGVSFPLRTFHDSKKNNLSPSIDKLMMYLSRGAFIAFVAGFCNSYASEKLARKNEMVLYGETTEQYETRKELEKLCHELDAKTPASYGVKAFVDHEEKNLHECKALCKKASEFHKDMRHNMQARRESNYGDSSYGSRRLQDVYSDYLTRTEDGGCFLWGFSPLSLKIEDLHQSIFSRKSNEEATKQEAEGRARFQEAYARIKKSGQ